MFHKVLICSDGSGCALRGAHMGVGIARHFGAQVLALNVFDNSFASAGYAGVWSMAIDQTVIDRCAQEQKEAIEQDIKPLCAQADVACETLQEFGHPVDQIVRVAERENVDLIVISSRGLNSAEEFLMGSVSNGVLLHAHCPVLIVRGTKVPRDMPEFRHILLTTDASRGANRATLVAIQMAQRFATSLDVLNVFDDQSLFGSLPADEDPTGESDSELYAARLLDLITDEVREAARDSGVYCAFHQETGHPAEAILRFANHHETDLIVLGSRGLGTFRSLLLGSVSNRVSHRANCPVLVVR